MTEIETTQPKKAKKSKGASEPRTWTESLDVKMTEKELADLAPRIDSAIAQVEALDEQRKAANDGFKARIELAEAHVRELRAFAASGKKKADVKVEERFVFDINTAIVTRTDTGEEVRRRALSPDERQATLPLLEEPLTATVGEIAKKRGRAPSPKRGPTFTAAEQSTEQCTKVVAGDRCTRPLRHKGTHGYKQSPKEN